MHWVAWLLCLLQQISDLEMGNAVSLSQFGSKVSLSSKRWAADKNFQWEKSSEVVEF